MTDRLSRALSDFIDHLPDDPKVAAELVRDQLPFGGDGELPELAGLAASIRAVEPYQPPAEWLTASKARLMAAPLLPPERRGFTWLGMMFSPVSQLVWPIPRLSLPVAAFGRAAVALVLVVAMLSLIRTGTRVVSPLMQVAEGDTASGSNTRTAEQAITLASQVGQLVQEPDQTVAGVFIKGTPRDVVLMAQYFALAEQAVEKAPPAQRQRLRSELGSVVRAIHFDGFVEAVGSNGTVTIGGATLQVDSHTASQMTVGQAVSVAASVEKGGQVSAQRVTVVSNPVPAPTPASVPASTPAPVASNSPSPSAGTVAGVSTSSADHDGDAKDKDREAKAHKAAKADQDDKATTAATKTADRPERSGPSVVVPAAASVPPSASPAAAVRSALAIIPTSHDDDGDGALIVSPTASKSATKDTKDDVGDKPAARADAKDAKQTSAKPDDDQGVAAVMKAALTPAQDMGKESVKGSSKDKDDKKDTVAKSRTADTRAAPPAAQPAPPPAPKADSNRGKDKK